MAGSYSCDDQTRIHESKEGISFIALRIKLTFLALKKSGTSPKWGVGGRGGRGNLDKIQKNIYFFS